MVYVRNMDGKPLMPCSPAIARLLLKQGKVKVKRRTPFTGVRRESPRIYSWDESLLLFVAVNH